MKSYAMTKVIGVWRTNTDWHGNKNCSKSYGNHSQKLADEIATLAKYLLRKPFHSITYQLLSHADLFPSRKKTMALGQ